MMNWYFETQNQMMKILRMIYIKTLYKYLRVWSLLQKRYDLNKKQTKKISRN